MSKAENFYSVDNISPEILSNETLFFHFIGELFQPTKASADKLVSAINFFGIDALSEFKTLKSHLERLNGIDPEKIPDSLNELEPCLKAASVLVKSKFIQKSTVKSLLTQQVVEKMLINLTDFMSSMKQFQKSLIVLINKVE